MDPARLVELAPAYVALIIFVWYTLSRDKQHGEDNKSRDLQWREFLKAQADASASDGKTRDGHWEAFLTQEREHWVEMLTLERSQRKEAMEYGMRQVDALTQATSSLTEAINAHEYAAQQRYERLMDAVARPAKIR